MRVSCDADTREKREILPGELCGADKGKGGENQGCGKTSEGGAAGLYPS